MSYKLIAEIGIIVSAAGFTGGAVVPSRSAPVRH
jgi:hypothetical protein